MSNDAVPEGFIYVAKLGKTFGLQGGLRVYALGEAEGMALAEASECYVTGLGLRKIKALESKGASPVVYLAGVVDVEGARAHTGAKVYLTPSKLSNLDEGEYYLDHVIGLEVWLNGELQGEVRDVIEAGSQDVLLCDIAGLEVMVPLQADYVELGEERLDIKQPPAGLLELNLPQKSHKIPHEI